MKSWRYGVLFILGGGVVLFATLYASEQERISFLGTISASAKPIPITAFLPSITIMSSVLLLLQAIAITAVGFGLFDIVLSTRDWRDYFEQRIKDIVIQQDYLQNLGTDILDNLQTNVLKARFRDPSIDREGSFLTYFYQNLNKYIADPYREEATCEIFYEGFDDEGIKIHDKISYTCRKSGIGIQKNIRWQPDPNEFVKVFSLKVSIKFPYSHEEPGKIVSLLDEQDLSAKKCEEIDIDVSLDAHKDIDQLIVIVESHYLVAHERFQYWQMTHPTKNFEITITFPAEYEIQLKPLVLNEDLCQKTNIQGYAKIKYDSWMLPMSGVAWRISKKRQPASIVS
jgi:hypothetical protein